jgi:hypothetical protein
MITELVTFFGAQGQRHAQLLFLATCIAAPYAVDFFTGDDDCFLTKFFMSEEEAEEAARLFAFEGVLK